MGAAGDSGCSFTGQYVAPWAQGSEEVKTRVSKIQRGHGQAGWGSGVGCAAPTAREPMTPVGLARGGGVSALQRGRPKYGPHVMTLTVQEDPLSGNLRVTPGDLGFETRVYRSLFLRRCNSHHRNTTF